MRRPCLRFVSLACLAMWLAPLAAATEQVATFEDAELDQLLAPIALHPDSLLSQVLMASTYPIDVAEAVTWSKAHPGQDGDAAVTAVDEQAWDPSVKSLVAFPQVLAMMGDKPDWVQNLGDAFLAEPDRVMDRVQFLRKKAREAGNLETTEQQKVVVERETIVIHSASPQVVYVPAYNPVVIYGTWWWPAYRPWYWYPPGYGVVTGIGFGIGIGITNSLWGGFHWGRHDVNINVNRYNNIHVHNRIDSSKRDVGWKHDPDRRRGTPYRDAGSRERFGREAKGGDRHGDFRGRDASRERAERTLAARGADPSQAREKLRNDPGTRDRARAAAARTERGSARAASPTADRKSARAAAQRTERGRTRELSNRRGSDHAFRSAGNPRATRQHVQRGTMSRGSARAGGRMRR